MTKQMIIQYDERLHSQHKTFKQIHFNLRNLNVKFLTLFPYFLVNITILFVAHVFKYALLLASKPWTCSLRHFQNHYRECPHYLMHHLFH